LSKVSIIAMAENWTIWETDLIFLDKEVDD